MNRILVVDDEPSMRKALSMGLSSGDYDVDVQETAMVACSWGL